MLYLLLCLLVFLVGVSVGMAIERPSPYANLPSRYTVSKDGT